ncbi:MAG TPA: phage holin family protein [Vicinamibacterales bacterium]|nr:phage holin family protein [Vicinamibacterales bacterium]
MHGYDNSVADLIRTTLHDAQDLVRGEIALAKAELREEARRFGAGAAELTAACVGALIASVFLLTALALGLPLAFGWPAWTGFALVGGLVLVAAVVLGLMGKKQFYGQRHMPLTMETMKENMQWTRARRS